MRTLLLTVFLLALPASADPLTEVCNKLIGSQVSECLAAGKGYVDAHAAKECGKLVGSQVVSCIAAAANKDYANGEQHACGGLVGGQVIDCFKRAGHPHATASAPGPAPTTAEIRAELAAAIEQLHANDVPGADARLRKLLASLR